MPPSTAVAEMQQRLFKRIGVDLPEPQRPQRHNGRGAQFGPLSRKLQRKNQRVQNKSDRQPAQKITKRALPKRKAQEASRRKVANEEEFEPESDEDEFEVEEDEEDGSDDLGSEDEDESTNDEQGETFKDSMSSKNLPSAVREKLAQDDAEIDEYARKLGIKKGRKSLPQAFKDDGLDDLFEDIDAISSAEGSDDGLKRKRDYDDWLSAKRSKTDHNYDSGTDSGTGSGADSGADLKDIDAGPDEDDESFQGFESDDEEVQRSQNRVREDPYKAPTTGSVVAKYVPPSRRQGSSGKESEARSRLQRQIQGQINRLTEANMLPIVQAMEELYQTNARGDVTELLTNVIMAQMQGPDNLSDAFFVLTGGFCAAIYKVIGSSFGSHLVREVARHVGQAYETSSQRQAETMAIRKEASNMIGFLSQLYLFGVVGCKIIFDYMERFLASLSELNVELLLRICRMAGRSLRKDDANALRHVTSILGAAVAKVGYASVSARTKFMVEMLEDLKSSKPKVRAGSGMESAVVSDHVVRMRKRLGELKSLSRRLDGLAPMGVGLEDIEQADMAGKWWLVGASVPAGDGQKRASKSTCASASLSSRQALCEDEEDMDLVLPDYPKKARDQGLHTVAQMAIFTAVMSANDYEHGYRQFVGLGLKRNDQLEIARVLVQCVGSETQYNEYYALLGKKACSASGSTGSSSSSNNNNKVRFAFQDRLWKVWKSLGESLFGGAAGDDDDAETGETADSQRMRDARRIENVARFYASLVSNGAMSIAVLKPLNLLQVNEWTAMFVQFFVVSLLRACCGKGGTDGEAQVRRIFGPAAEIPSLAAGLFWFLRQGMQRTMVVSADEIKKLHRVREKARAVVQRHGLDDSD